MTVNLDKIWKTEECRNATYGKLMDIICNIDNDGPEDINDYKVVVCGRDDVFVTVDREMRTVTITTKPQYKPAPLRYSRINVESALHTLQDHRIYDATFADIVELTDGGIGRRDIPLNILIHEIPGEVCDYGIITNMCNGECIVRMRSGKIVAIEESKLIRLEDNLWKYGGRL